LVQVTIIKYLFQGFSMQFCAEKTEETLPPSDRGVEKKQTDLWAATLRSSLSMDDLMAYGLLLGQLLAALTGSYAIITGLQLFALPSQLRLLMGLVTVADQVFKWVKPVTSDASVWVEQRYLGAEKNYLQSPDSPRSHSEELGAIVRQLDRYFEETKNTNRARLYPADFSCDERLLVDGFRHEYRKNQDFTYNDINKDLCKRGVELLRLFRQKDEGHDERMHKFPFLFLDMQLHGEERPEEAIEGIITQKLRKLSKDYNLYDKFVVKDIAQTLLCTHAYQATVQMQSEREDWQMLNENNLKAWAWSCKQLSDRLSEMHDENEGQDRYAVENKSEVFWGVFCAVRVPYRTAILSKIMMGIIATLVGFFSAYAVFQHVSVMQRDVLENKFKDFFWNQMMRLGYRFCLGMSGMAAGIEFLFFCQRPFFYSVSYGLVSVNNLFVAVCISVGASYVYRGYLCTQNALVRRINANAKRWQGWPKADEKEKGKSGIKTIVLRAAYALSLNMILKLAILAQCCASVAITQRVTNSFSIGVLASLGVALVHYLEQKDKYDGLALRLNVYSGVSSQRLDFSSKEEGYVQEKQEREICMRVGQGRRRSC
jgi:hypothetical protein